MLVDVDDTIVEVHGYAKQGAGFGYSKVRGLNALLATASTTSSAPVVVAQRLRRGSCGSPRGARRLVADAVTTVSRLAPGPAGAAAGRLGVLRPDTIGAAVRAGAQVSVTVSKDVRVKAAIADIPDDAWTPIAYREAVFDETDRPVDLPRRGRRDPVHRLRVPAGGPAGAGPAGGAPDPRAEPDRPRRAVRRVAVPRLLHHHAAPWTP